MVRVRVIVRVSVSFRLDVLDLLVCDIAVFVLKETLNSNQPTKQPTSVCKTYMCVCVCV